jgi:cell division protein FtsI (penicillin-binding protein 3)
VKGQRVARRRLALAVLLTIAIVGVFVVRLVDIQVVRAAELNTASLNKRAVAVTTFAARGNIVDANGVVLADSVTRIDVTASPKYAAKFKRTNKNGKTESVSVFKAVNEIAAITGQDPAKMFLALTEDPTSDFTYLAKSQDTANWRKIRALKIPWVYPQDHPTRTYPNGAVAGNIVGFVGTDGPQNGIETTENKCLASTDGSSTYERGADGVRLPGSTVTSKAAIDGGTVKLSIDYDLSWFVQQKIAEQAMAIGAQSATGIVMRKDGHLMAVADWPSVDPNDVDATPVDNLGSLAFTAAYEPGSTFKAMTAAMLIDQGAAAPTSRAVVPGVFTSPEGGIIHDAWAHDDLHLTLTGVLQRSSNIGISIFGSRLTPSVRYDYMRKFGLGQRTAVQFQGESVGLLTPVSQWDSRQKYNVMFGQGVSATGVQVASIFQTLANGGVRMPVALVESCTASDGTVTDLPDTTGTRVISEAAADTTVHMLESVVTGGDLSAQLSIPGYRVAAKTGTAEVATNGVYTKDRVVSVAGIAPADDPQYIVVVTFVKPRSMKTSAAAAPTFRQVMTQVLKHYRVTPSTTPTPDIATVW